MAGTVYTIVGTVRNASPEADANTAKLVQLAEEHPGTKVLVRQLDLGRLADVRSFADNLSSQIAHGDFPPISAIVCNAMTLSLESGLKYTQDGFEATFQVSHLAHYLMVLKLLGSIDMASGRVIMLGSITHYPERRNPLSAFRPEFPANLEHLVKPPADRPEDAHDRGQQRYGTAKLANVTFMHDLNKRLEADPNLSRVTVTALDPGGLPASRSQARQKTAVRCMMAAINFAMPVLKHFTSVMRPTADAARDLVTLSVDPAFKGQRGYFVGLKPDVDAEISRDAKAQERLWSACWKWADLSPEETILKDAVP